MSFRTSTLTAPKNCRTCTHHRANYFSVRWQMTYPRAITLTPRTSGSDSPSKRSASTMYLKTDVLLLADIFENFRISCVASYGLDPAHYFTIPGFAWNAILKHTRIRFELLTDIDMIMFIDRSILGGLNVLADTHRLITSTRLCDSSKPSSYLSITTWIICTDERCLNPCRISMDRRRKLWHKRDRSGFAHRLHSRNRTRVFTTSTRPTH